MLKVVATICAISNPDSCRDVQVTTSDLSGLTLQGCLMGAPQLAAFMEMWPAYRLVKWRCEMGERSKVKA